MKSTALIKRHEQCRLKPYRDTKNILTIGWGTNIEKISQEEADLLFEHRFQGVRRDAARFPWFLKLNHIRQAVIENMIYNMGLFKFSQFKKMIAAIEAEDWDLARHEMLYNSDGSEMSPWAKDVGWRAMELAHMMQSGEWLG